MLADSDTDGIDRPAMTSVPPRKQDVRGKMSGTSRMQHPVAGLLEPRSEKFVVTGADRQLMIVYHVDPGTRSYEALQELASQAGQTRSLWPN